MNPQFPNLNLLIAIQLVVWLAMLALSIFVVYMFYARLRDIADELRKIRFNYEFDLQRTAKDAARPPSTASQENPFASESRYTPKA